jgi:predicted DNA-binding transcriptional regulator AlpA
MISRNSDSMSSDEEVEQTCSAPMADGSQSTVVPLGDLVRHLRLDQGGSLSAPPMGTSGDWAMIANPHLDPNPPMARSYGRASEETAHRPLAAPTAPVAETPPIAIDARGAARLCGISRSLWHSMKAAGRIPLPIRLGRRVLWRVEELHAWVKAGCPPLHRWEQIKNSAGKTG